MTPGPMLDTTRIPLQPSSALLAPQPPARLQVKVDKHITFEIWDLAGQANLRPSWASYYQATHAVVVVADSTDRARLGILKQSCSSSCSMSTWRAHASSSTPTSKTWWVGVGGWRAG